MPTTGHIVAVCLSSRKGETKKPCPEGGVLIENSGLEGDAHAGPGNRQVSLLCTNSIDKIRPVVQAAGRDLAPGDFAENLTIDGFEFEAMPLGARLRFPSGAELEISQIGKECHSGCAIREIVGDCVMPREGVFGRVVNGGRVAPGDAFEVAAPLATPKLQIGILVLSDRASVGAYEDKSGPEAIAALEGVGEVAEIEVIADDFAEIRRHLIDWCDQRRLDVILTLGGTGFSARDVTPEATRSVLDRETPGITSALLLNGLEKTKRAMLSRAASGLRGNSLIVNLPGKPSAVRESIEYLRDVLPHAVHMVHGGDHE